MGIRVWIFQSAACLFLAAPAFAQSDDPFGGKYLSLLRRPDVRNALDLELEQGFEVAQLVKERAQVGSALFRKIRTLPQEERQAFFEETKQQLALLDQQVTKILLPNQVERLNQIDLQFTVRADSASSGLTDKRIIDALKLTESQIDTIKKEAAELEEKVKEKAEAFRKELLKAKQEARNEVLKHLTEEQRKEYFRLLGELFDPIMP